MRLPGGFQAAGSISDGKHLPSARLDLKKANNALETAKRMDPRFAEEVMKKLLYRDGFEEITAVAQKRTIEVLEAVRT